MCCAIPPCALECDNVCRYELAYDACIQISDQFQPDTLDTAQIVFTGLWRWLTAAQDHHTEFSLFPDWVIFHFKQKDPTVTTCYECTFQK